jgi:hypothetical protein
MQVLETEQEKKSFFFTTISFGLLFLLFWLLKMSNDVQLSQLEGGGGGGDIAVNFGNSDTGMGDNFESLEMVRSAPKPTPQSPVTAKEIIVSDDDDAPAIADVKKPAEKPKKTVTETPVVKTPPKPQPSKATQSALDDLLNGSDKSGDGNDKVGGNKGKSYGSTSATGYDGGGGSGTGSGGGNGSGQGIGTGSGYGSGSGGGRGNGVGNYSLGNRKPLTKPQPNYLCDEQGTVAVKIVVDRSGKVISATAGDRGTTNRAQCLAEQAEIAAMNTRWQADDNAAEKQVGKIIYNFRLTQ